MIELKYYDKEEGMSMIAKRFAKALFGMLTEDSLSAVSKDLQHLKTWLQESPDLQRTLRNP